MGRPLNKRYFGNDEGAIAVTAYRIAGGTPTLGGDSVYITRQRSTNKFVINVSGTLHTLKLVDKATEDLAVGEFRVEARDDQGNLRNVRKFYSHKVVMGPVAGDATGEAAEVVREDVEFRRVQIKVPANNAITISTSGSGTISGLAANVVSRSGISANDTFTFGSFSATGTPMSLSGTLQGAELTVVSTSATAINFIGAGTGTRGTVTIGTGGAQIFVEGSGDRAAVDSQES